MTPHVSLFRHGRERSFTADGGCGPLHAFTGMNLAQIVEAVRLLRMLGDRTLLDTHNRAATSDGKSSGPLAGQLNEQIKLVSAAPDLQVGNVPAGSWKHRRQH